MFSNLRASVAAAAIALIGIAGAGTASAKPILPVGPNKLVIKFCHPHYEYKKQYLGIKKIGFRYYRVYKITTIYVDKYCFKTVVNVRLQYVPLPWFHRGAPAGV